MNNFVQAIMRRVRGSGAGTGVGGASVDDVRFYQCLVATVAILCYLNAIGCGFVFDDISAVKDNKDLRPHTPISNILRNDFWGTPMYKEQSHKSYRPLCVLTFRLNYMVHGLDAHGFHIVNVALHVLVCILYLKLCLIFLSPLTSLFASLLFCVHPVHTEAVTGVVGRAETLSSVFFLAAFLSYVSCATGRQTNWTKMMLSMLFGVAAMLSKEQGVTVLGICFVYELFIVQKLKSEDVMITLSGVFQGKHGVLPYIRHTLTRTLFIVVTTVLVLALRVKIMGSQLPVFTKFDNPASAEPSPYRQLTYNYLYAVNSWLLLFPSNLCCDWTMGTIPVVTSLHDVRNIATVAFYIVLAKLIHSTGIFHSSTSSYLSASRESSSHQNVVIISLSLTILPFLPASNLFFPVGFVVAERILYLPSMGFCMLVAYGCSLLYNQQNYKKIASIFAVFLIFSHACKTVRRNYDWESEISIFTSGISVNSKNAKLYNNVGHALETTEDYAAALEYFQKAVNVQSDDIGAHINVGRTLNNLKMYTEAEEAYRKAKNLLPRPKPREAYQTRIAPNHLNVFLNLANLISRNESRLEEADALYRQAISMRADYTQAYINRGDILIKMNRTKEAQEVYEKALQYDNNNADIYYNLGVVFLEQGKALQALAYLDKALEFDPEHEQALMNSAVLIQETGNPSLQDIAYKRLLRLLEKDQMNERAYFNLGMLGMDRKDYVNAEKWFKMSIQLKEDFRSALFNLALLLSDTNRPLEAAPFLQQLLKFHPDHIKGLILLGDIFINNIKDLDRAEECYNQIMKLDPKNVQGLHNLCVVYVEQGRLEKAEKCMAQAAVMAPHEEYIQRHLKILRARIRSKNSKNHRNNDQSLTNNGETKNSS